MDTAVKITPYTLTEEEEKKEILRHYRGLLKALKPKIKPGDKNCFVLLLK
jgi:guanosine-3',5'-bis(diphosphate) 3'-pyrophosphohydrolase